jgi:hypothetical protein
MKRFVDEYIVDSANMSLSILDEVPILNTVYNLGNLYTDQGRLEEAEEI